MRIIDRILDRIHQLVHGRPCPTDEDFDRQWFTEEQVATKLDTLAADHKRETGEALDWRKSHVDLRKLVGEPSDIETRKEDAAEQGFDGQPGSAEMNLFLQDRMMSALRKRWIAIPRSGDA
jgi:hypothetical protein